MLRKTVSHPKLGRQTVYYEEPCNGSHHIENAFPTLETFERVSKPLPLGKQSVTHTRSYSSLQGFRKSIDRTRKEVASKRSYSYRIMAAPSQSPDIGGIIRAYFPDIATDSSSTAGSKVDGLQLSQTLYPKTNYAESDKTIIDQEIDRSTHLVSDSPRVSEQLQSLNEHLSTRTTALGSKPSAADAVLYARLAPLVKKWSQEEKTGQHGYHHIVRYVDFVQNSPLLGLSLSEQDKIPIDPKDVLTVPKAIDPKQEKERKKKEKAALSDGGEAQVVVGQTKEQHGKGGKQKLKDITQEAKESVKGAISSATSATKKEKKEKAPKSNKQPGKDVPLSPALIDLRVGHILKAELHPNADSLFVSTIAVGDAPGTDNTSEFEGQIVRTVCSGLNGLIPLEEMQNRKIVAVCNLKPVTMRGIKSCAMVLAASPRLGEGEVDNHAGPVELVSPPQDAKAGQRIMFEGWEGEPEPVLNPKKKVWDMCQVGFTTTDDLGVAFEKGKVEQLIGEAGQDKPEVGKLTVKGGGPCVVKSLKGATVR